MKMYRCLQDDIHDDVHDSLDTQHHLRDFLRGVFAPYVYLVHASTVAQNHTY